MRRALILALIALCGFAACAVVTLTAASDRHFAIGTGGACSGASDSGLAAVAEELGEGYGNVQARHAITIWQVAIDRDLPERAGIIAIATAMQESTLKVLYNPKVPGSKSLPHDGKGEDHDSVGLFQQRPHWGPLETLMDPAGSAGLFYDALENVADWENLPLTVAAQRVQVSAFANAYAQHEPFATAAADVIKTIVCSGEWVHPVPGAGVNSGWRTSARPSHNGIDLDAGRGEPILAASAGEVVTVVCNAHTVDGRLLSCDVDGSPQIAGCGWYVEIAHAEQILSRYCHMRERPTVRVGDQLRAGDILGYVGSSGRSSGPHLHLEIHTSHSPTFDTALDPEIFFSSKGVEL
ncbi:M23 family metallopeptidase [Glycomyces sp. NRRL B-16210]|uniref:M23 family metallopeptidase n=1 Tax=Glycomyces sp. NRRL B-16210 TaxID=1463821 RepID=UPI0006909C47|nr:M23 family metallopeptidase [Glycomyces sp. NRRL B-16210]